MYYGNIKEFAIEDGEGIRTVLFVSGCTHRCRGCFQPETWDFSYGKPYTEETERYILDSLAPDYIEGLTVLGGEPMEPENQETVLSLIRKVKERFPEKNVWIYTGYTLEQLTGEQGSRAATVTAKEILSIADVLVDGEFIEEEKDPSLDFRGSRNQRIIDLKKVQAGILK